MFNVASNITSISTTVYNYLPSFDTLYSLKDTDIMGIATQSFRSFSKLFEFSKAKAQPQNVKPVNSSQEEVGSNSVDLPLSSVQPAKIRQWANLFFFMEIVKIARYLPIPAVQASSTAILVMSNGFKFAGSYLMLRADFQENLEKAKTPWDRIKYGSTALGYLTTVSYLALKALQFIPVLATEHLLVVTAAATGYVGLGCALLSTAMHIIENRHRIQSFCNQIAETIHKKVGTCIFGCG